MTYLSILKTILSSFLVDCGMYIANILCICILKAGFEDALSARYSFAATSALGSSSGVSALKALTAVE
jgi:hypothetical protein